ncbi:isochorismatase family protein [Streptomyces sp. SID3343]|uniref:isochorismatase family protein n=1 Tax=Streptomyces sp. SID3343 TaxID=2690260 RepID=UPI00136F6E6C|nr:isochorismatase family protein [Streptomyces sp. SID3343]MYW03284.1 isochorismatase family protein [Streptomyces sp. SID3343]
MTKTDSTATTRTAAGATAGTAAGEANAAEATAPERTAPAVAGDAVLIVIDVQKGFDDAEFWGKRNNPDAEANIAALVAAWERTGRPVVLVRHDSTDPSPLHPDTPGNDFKDVVAEVEPDLLVTKHVNSAFYGTPDLHAWLTARGANQLVIVGIQTNMCNETTARMAGNLGYDVLFAIDAMHTFELAGPDGDVMTADELTRATVTTLHGGRFARIVHTADLLAATA